MNIKKYTSLKKELEKVIENYHKNAIDSSSTIAELVVRARHLQEEDYRNKELGISDEELAFYDTLSQIRKLSKKQVLFRILYTL